MVAIFFLAIFSSFDNLIVPIMWYVYMVLTVPFVINPITKFSTVTFKPFMRAVSTGFLVGSWNLGYSLLGQIIWNKPHFNMDVFLWVMLGVTVCLIIALYVLVKVKP